MKLAIKLIQAVKSRKGNDATSRFGLCWRKNGQGAIVGLQDRGLPYLAFLVAVLLSAACLAGQEAHYRRGRAGVVLPDPTVTPGAVGPHTTEELCSKTFTTRDERHTSAATKDQVYREYGVERGKGMCAGGCEVDHLQSLELGGADEIKNLWPQPSQGIGYRKKDALENRLHKMVCAGKITLRDAQKCIAGDWFDCGIKVGAFNEKGVLLKLK